MCGILGLVTRQPLDPRDLARLNATLTHRGPDAAGAWQDESGRVSLAHCRLSIIDLSDASAQPMAFAADRLHIVYNGELYNYRELRTQLQALGHAFRSDGDTEVVLAAYHEWGPACVHRFLGMFAFGIHDARTRTVFLARDRAGEKPLFYTLHNGELRFASELKALLANDDAPRRMNALALDHYLAFGFVPGALCMVDGVHKLPPAHTLSFDIDSGRADISRYWELPASNPQSHDADALTNQLETLLGDAVQRQLVADVPVGILLSGGTDSSIIAALAARAQPGRVRTFTVSFPGHASHDEAPYARQVAAHIGTHHTELAADAASVDVLPQLVRQFDEPIADSSMIPTFIVSRLIREHATVALGGDGGDELFGGYPHYSWLQQQERFRRFVPAPARALMHAAGARMPYGARGRNYLTAFPASRAGAVAAINMYFDASTRRRLLRGLRAPHAADASPEQYRIRQATYGDSVLQAAAATDFQGYLPDDLLVKVDRASMLASLEVRAPFLDHRVIEFAFRDVPDHLRATRDERKVLLRALGARLLPRDLDLRRKQGFSIPIAAWLAGEWGRALHALLHEADWLDRATIDALFRGQARGRNNTQRIFALAVLEMWRREYDIALPAAEPAA